MKTVIATFFISLALSLVLTPAAKWLGVRFGALDRPSMRKVHTRAIPRSGGPAIVLSFFLAFFAGVTFLPANATDLLIIDRKWALFAAGGIVVFAVGFFDDFRRLGPKVKFLFQIIATSIAFYGGLRIEGVGFGDMALRFEFLSYFVTVFWFLLLINAINLIDGLDGLAAGVAFFTSFVMVVLSITQPGPGTVLEFAALGGAVLGFLRYNFNPASIFMGDGGSYFLGYTIAALAIMGSVKSQVGATLLIPLLALGVPIFDTLLSPVRRFLLGRRMFQPDKEHIHHRLMVMGLTARRTVLLIYGATFALCVFAILLVNLHNVPAGLLLFLLGFVTIFCVRKLGYLEYLAVDKVYGWLRDIYDVTGLSQDRRSFLAIQIETDRSQSMEELWRNICQAMEVMHLDRGELHLFTKTARAEAEGMPAADQGNLPPSSFVISAENGRPGYKGSERRKRRDALKAEGGTDSTVMKATPEMVPDTIRVWVKGRYRREADAYGSDLLRIEVPIRGKTGILGKLVLIKDLSRELTYPYILRRVEFLRRTATNAMERLMKGEEIK